MTTSTSLGFLGPARVLATSGRPGYVQLAFAGGEPVWARMAIPYEPAPGDEVLVISQEPPTAYVIGVLDGRGVTALRVPGDLRLEAPQGRVQIIARNSIDLQSTESVELTAPRGTFRFARLNLLATTLVQRATNVFTWATGLLQSKSRRMRCVTEEGWLVRAGRAHLKTTENVHINGKTIHLG